MKYLIKCLIVGAVLVALIYTARFLSWRDGYDEGSATGHADCREDFACLLMPMSDTKYDLPDTIHPGDYLMWDMASDTVFAGRPNITTHDIAFVHADQGTTWVTKGAHWEPID